MPAAADLANERMVDRLIAEGAMWEPAVIAAFRATPRHRFLDRVFRYSPKDCQWREILTREPTAAQLRLIYSDRALVTGLRRAGRGEPEVPISSSSQPSLMAQMLQDLRLAAGLRVLEVGAGTGYNAALLAHLVGPDRVTTVDVDRDVLSRAWDNLRAFPERHVRLHHADGRAGLAEQAPFDRIMVTAASRDLEPAWLEQLAAGGLLQAPLVLVPGLEFIAQGTVRDGVFDGRLVRAAYFMPLRAEDETGLRRPEFIPTAAAQQTVTAPWAGWFDRRRPRLSWLGFSQSLAFLAYLRGLSVHPQTLEDNQTAFTVGEPTRHRWCSLGVQEWRVSDDAGQELGLSLWQEFLELGGPWPTEFRLLASPAPERLPNGGTAYEQKGLSCRHRWELIERRERPAWL